MEKAIECLTKKYADFSGRASRSEYWMFILITKIASFLLAFIDGFSGTYNTKTGDGLLSIIFSITLLIPALAVTVRRLHDVNKSGWWSLIAIIFITVPFFIDVDNVKWWFITISTIIGFIWLFVQFCTKGTEGDNRFGSDPLQV